MRQFYEQENLKTVFDQSTKFIGAEKQMGGNFESVLYTGKQEAQK